MVTSKVGYEVIEASDLQGSKCPKCNGQLKVIKTYYSSGLEPELMYTDTIRK